MDHQSGNLTGLFIAEEETLGVLPATPVWKEREPNSYADFGGNFSMTTRKPITHDRQHLKGEVSDNNPSGGHNEDLTPTNMVDLMQGFLYADAREKPSSNPLNGTYRAMGAVSASADKYTAAAGLGSFLVGHLVLAEGFGVQDNNGLNRVTAVSATELTMASPLEDEATPPATAQVTAVGFQFGSGVLTITVSDDSIFLDTGAIDATTLGLTPGEWIGVGGDDTATRFADTGNNAPFYGRVSAVTADGITLDKTTGVQVTASGTGKTIQIFFGTVIRNESDCTLIKARSYTLERQYGCGDEAEAEYVKGASANQLTITVPTPAADAKVTVDLAFIGTGSFERDATEGVLDGTRVTALNEACFKPGLDVYQHKLAVIDETTLNPTPLVAYNSEVSLVINNNLAGNKAIESFGNSGMNIGEFTVTGSIGAYWTSVQATRKVRQGADLTWHLILTKSKAAAIFDVASLGLGNGRATVEANTPVKLPLETAAGKGKFGYTLLATFLRYSPAVLMAQANT